MTAKRIYLTVATIGLIPIALAYGLIPQKLVPILYGFEPNEPNGVHIFRGVMGLYLATAAYWALGARQEKWRDGALMSAIVFMVGLAAGRALSLIIDGIPEPLLWVYLLLEVAFAVWGIAVLCKKPEQPSSTID